MGRGFRAVVRKDEYILPINVTETDELRKNTELLLLQVYKLGLCFTVYWSSNSCVDKYFTKVCRTIIFAGKLSFKYQCIYWHNYFRTLHQVNKNFY